LNFVIDLWRKLWGLSRRERMLFACAALLLPVTRLALGVAGFRRWQSVLRALSRGRERPPAGDALEQARRTAAMVGIAARRGVSRANCLPQSLVLWFLLRRQGIESRLRIGARKTNDSCEAHAWVEYLGRVLNDSQDVNQRFAAFRDASQPDAG
jgi:Transglutaminase-like superfamily